MAEPVSRRRPAVEVAVALGSNVPHGTHGRPRQVLRAAVAALRAAGLEVERLSPIVETAPLGPSKRRYANAALKGRWRGGALELLALLKRLERAFGRRRGRRWGARVLDLDLIALGDAQLRLKGLEVPHPRLQQRDFVLGPLETVWPGWRHPRTGLSVRQMRARLKKPRAVD
ncbi:2-amino-4-hydroxy-6-hydroxymethyldihydropteridine diphosphokinase [Sandaracinobacter sp. RS1-74]|uniref:2-amino-4-hydroxy-6- hydroxymethyldihydropteridine diphosphokinase n=1 Tax=Sandaracinobacteroides sayramensis TaxID=2913411 RepID=UPI001EDAEA49|nr:2-amino-4-hydroxy-6-hydroxymethyldihydropteridine diphosphokinase [Sandaracinobacteroides sayramensis]MCG2839837.1 2-amino-4-hydroxy-6-hydroxymethyldihydropteridine diphosphokinase [Sandaracinobacteroides sayramensis]